MSFDLRLKNGDIAIGNDADIAIVSNSAKLVQDVIKIITTPIGENIFQPAIGSQINKRLIGQVLTAQNTISILKASVEEALTNLQKLQKQQSQTQTLSPSETLVQINDISVSRDSSEPRQLNVILKLMSADGGLITETFSMLL